MGISPAEWLVAPMVAIEEERAAALLMERFNIEGTLEELGSNHDRNFRVRTGLNEHGYVFKVFNPVIDRAVLRAQSEATERLALALPELRLPRARVGVDGEHIQTVSVDGRDYDCQLLDYVPGEPIMDSRYLAPRVVARLGELAGRITAALEGLDIPTPDRPMLWDLRNALEVVEALAPHMVDQRRAERVLRAARAAQPLVERRAARIPLQVIHGDVADNNVVCRTDPDGRPIPVGLIDFGDLTHSWAVAELAVATLPSCIITEPHRLRCCPRSAPSTPYGRSAETSWTCCGPLSYCAAACWWYAGSTPRCRTPATATPRRPLTVSGPCSRPVRRYRPR